MAVYHHLSNPGPQQVLIAFYALVVEMADAGMAGSVSPDSHHWLTCEIDSMISETVQAAHQVYEHTKR